MLLLTKHEPIQEVQKLLSINIPLGFHTIYLSVTHSSNYQLLHYFGLVYQVVFLLLLTRYCWENLYKSIKTEKTKLVDATKMVKVIANDLIQLALLVTSNPAVTLLLATYITNPSNRYLLAGLFLVAVLVMVKNSQHTITDQNGQNDQRSSLDDDNQHSLSSLYDDQSGVHGQNNSLDESSSLVDDQNCRQNSSRALDVISSSSCSDNTPPFKSQGSSRSSSPEKFLTEHSIPRNESGEQLPLTLAIIVNN